MINYRIAAGITALVGGVVLVPAAAAHADATTYKVGNPARCAGVDFSTISAAVAAASSGDTIQVCAGTFGESVDINKPGLTLLGVRAGENAIGRTGSQTVVSNATGAFTIEGNADDTTIDGFTIQGGTSGNGVNAFHGSSGLTLVNNIIKLNLNGINMQNPDASKPALIEHNSFVNNNAGGQPGTNPETGTGVWITNGPANSTTITDNRFSQHSQTAINYTGDPNPNNRSSGLVVTDNTSDNDATFVVATNSVGSLIEDNSVTTSTNVPGGGHGSGILDYGNNTALQIRHNTMKATGPSGSTGISLNTIGGPSSYTTVSNNKVTGWANDVRVAGPTASGYITDNHLNGAQANGILILAGVSGIQVTHNTVHGAAVHACEDDTTGSGTAGTANLWRRNTADSASAPGAICANS